MNFYVPAKVVAYTSSNMSNFEGLVSDTPVRMGVYTTFFGPVFYDFGFLGGVFSFLFGFSVGKLGKQVRKGKLKWLPVYLYMLVVMVLIPIVSMFIYGGGQYIVISAIFTAYLFSWRWRNLGRRRKCSHEI